jgi:hypothetical protein
MVIKSPYFRNLHDTLIAANRKSLIHANSKVQGAAKVWDNVKTKNSKKYRPRGKVSQRLEAIQRKADWERLQRDTQISIDKLTKAGVPLND